MHFLKNILRKWFSYLENAILERLESMEKKLNNELADGLISSELAQQRMKQELQSVGKDVFSCY